MNIKSALHQAQLVITAGQIDRARDILLDVVRREPGNETALLMLADIAPEKANAIFSLEQILAYHPNNIEAQSRLASLKSIDPITYLPSKLSHEPVEAAKVREFSQETSPT